MPRQAKRLKMMEAAFASVADGVVIVDAKGRLVFVNDAAYRLAHGEPSPELPVTERAVEFRLRNLDGTLLRPEMTPLRRALRGENVVEFPLILSHPDSTETCVSITANPIRDEQGQIIGAVAIFRDVTTHREVGLRIMESEKRYKNLVELTTDLVYVSDAQGNLTFLNKAGLRALEATPDEVIGQPWLKWLHPDDRERTRQQFVEMIEKGQDVFDFENRYVSKSGKVITVLHNVRVIRDERGEVAGVQGIARDVTMRQRAEEALTASEERYRALAEAAADMIFIIGPEDRVQYVNSHAARQFGLRPEQIVGRRREELFPPDVSEVQRDNLRAVFETGEPTYREERTPFPDHEVWLGSWLTPIKDGDRVVAVMGIGRDITDRKRVEELREEYIHLISHDLRQPLTVLKGLADWLHRLLVRQHMPQEAHSAEAIVAAANRMNTMIQELVESARLESGHIELHRELTDLWQLITEIVQRVGSPEEQARIQTECPERVPPLAFDADHIERAVVNLITNALKYSPPNTPVVVHVGCRDGEAIVSVTDQGTGIPAEDLPNIFERFYRSKAGKKQAEGLGLGLYIARLIVETHGGRIWVDSEVGRGSTFGFALPLT